jgi:plastocyanin
MRKIGAGALAIAALLLVLVLIGCGTSSAPSSSGSSSSGTPQATVKVVLQNISIQPADVTVAVGGTVTWVNQDTVTHNLSDDAGTWSSGALAPGQSYSQKFSTAGKFPYHCIIHPSMTGQITVQ